MEGICEIVRKAETNYLQGNVILGKYVNWSMHDTIERIDAYLNSKHISGETDSLGRDKPFFDIVTAATNIWYRATDLDRKDIRFVAQDTKSIPLAFVANVMLQNWMNKNRFGQFLNAWGRSLARYGSSIVKFVEKDGELVPSVVPWNRYIADPVQFDALPRIEKFYMTPAQLRKMTQYDQQQVSELIEAKQTRRTLDRLQQDLMNDFIELYEVHGELDSRLLEDNPDENLDEDQITYRQQMHVISFIGSDDDKEGFRDFTLYRGKEANDPYMITHLIEEDGRTLGIGAVEHLFDAQWMQNHTIKNMKDTLDLASKLIFQTADTHFVGRNVLSAIEVGDVLVHDENRPLERIANDKPDVSALQDFGMMWRNMAQDVTSTPDALRGTTMPSGTPYALAAQQAQQASSLFEIMTENKGLSVEDMCRLFVIPNLKKSLKHKDEVVAVLDDAGIQEIDAMYIPREAINRFNQRTIQQTFDHIQNPDQVEPPQSFDPMQEQQGVQSDLGAAGNKRYFKPDELDQKDWDEMFSDFAWDSIRVEVTNENHDKQAALATLSSIFQSIAVNPAVLQDPNAKMLFSAILNETGVLSPMQISTAAAKPPMMPNVPPNVPAGSGGGAVALNS